MNGQLPAALRRFVPPGEVSALEVVATDLLGASRSAMRLDRVL
ncbi:hypothetical protein [Loktanella atrilutea]